jgi:SAM-dependent methyltransferase
MNTREYDNMARQESTHWWYTGMATLSARWLRTLPGNLAILDAGCGTGGNLRRLRAFGRPFGMDVSVRALQLADGAGPLVRADIQALPYRDASFGLVTSFEVLCQLPLNGDVTALREFVRVLQPGGWLLLRLPAHRWLFSAHDRFVQTQHRYGRAELLAKLRGVGLFPCRVRYANSLLFLPAVFWRLWQRHQPDASDVRALPAWLNACLRMLLRAERYCPLPFGLSLLVLARKEAR